MRRSQSGDVGVGGGKIPLHAIRNQRLAAFYSQAQKEVAQDIDPLPDDTPTHYVSESSATFTAQPTQLGRIGLTQRIFIDVEAFDFGETAEKIIFGNRNLPAFAEHDRFEALLKDDDTPVIVVAGPTGSGKSTQFPQFAVNAGYDIVKITQPRRAAANNVGDRIESEITKIAEDTVEMPQVAIRTGGEKKGPRDAAITITTEGYLLTSWQRLEADARSVKKVALILDEAHESSSDFEMLMVLSKKLLKDNPDCKLKVVVMSATLDAEFIADYFNDLPYGKPALIEVEGRMFDVTKHERPASNVVHEAVAAARILARNTNEREPNGVWVFVPGKREIKDVSDKIEEELRRLSIDVARQTTVLPFHAKLTKEEQERAFVHLPGVKIVVSTNAGETSVTDPDCKYVIDSGLARQMLLDEEQILGLERYHISRDECTQRAGRTGRVCPGTYILTRIDDEIEFVPFNYRDQSPVPEILRTDIVRHTLRTACFGYDINLLTEVPHPITQEALDRAKKILQIQGAFDENFELTPLGIRMNEFPASASSARMMAEADRYNQTTRAYMSAIVSCLEAGKLPLYAPDVEHRWKNLTEETASDLLAQLDLFIALQDMTEAEMRDHDIDINNYRRAIEQYKKISQRSDAEVDKLLPPTPQEKENLVACILAGSLHSIYVHDGGGEFRHLGDQQTKREISNRSLVRTNPRVLVGDGYRAEYWRGGEKRQKHIIENVTATTLANIGRAAIHLSHWKHEEFVLRDSKVMSRRGQHLFDEPLGVFEEAPARPSVELKQYLLDYALNHPGPNQKKLRKIKKETEELSLRAGGHIEQFTQARLESLIQQAIEDGLIDVGQIDNNLRILMEEQSMSLDMFVSPERRTEIYKNAPSEMAVGGTPLGITYKASGPEIRLKNNDELKTVLGLDHDVLLPDGRLVRFVYQGKKYTLHQLQEVYGL